MYVSPGCSLAAGTYSPSPFFRISLHEFGKFCNPICFGTPIQGRNYSRKCHWIDFDFIGDCGTFTLLGRYNMIFSLSLVLLAVLLTGISQVLLKMGSLLKNKTRCFLEAYLNIYSCSAYVLLLIGTVISVIALREIPLKMFYAITSLNFVLVIGLSWWVLKENVNMKVIIGIFLIISGIMLFNLL